MTQTPESRTLSRQSAHLSVHHLALMRPELPGLVAEIVAEAAASVPGYGALLDSPYGGLIRQCVHRNVATFVARIADPAAASPERDELCRTVGRLEALNGHSMDRLQTAYRIGVQVAWRRAIKVARRNNTPMPIVSAFTDTLFGYRVVDIGGRGAHVNASRDSATTRNARPARRSPDKPRSPPRTARS